MVSTEELSQRIIEKFKSRLGGNSAIALFNCKLWLVVEHCTEAVGFMGLQDGEEGLSLTLVICAPTRFQAAALEMARSRFIECAKGLGIDGIAFRDDKNDYRYSNSVED